VWGIPAIVEYWQRCFDDAHRKAVDAWDYQWAFSMWRCSGLQVVPNTNLISYIGCLPDAAHTSDTRAPYCDLPMTSVEFPLIHPPRVERDIEADFFEFYRVFLNQDDGVAEANSLSAARQTRSDA